MPCFCLFKTTLYCVRFFSFCILGLRPSIIKTIVEYTKPLPKPIYRYVMGPHYRRGQFLKSDINLRPIEEQVLQSNNSGFFGFGQATVNDVFFRRSGHGDVLR